MATPSSPQLSANLPLLQWPRLVLHHWRSNPLCAKVQYIFLPFGITWIVLTAAGLLYGYIVQFLTSRSMGTTTPILPASYLFMIGRLIAYMSDALMYIILLYMPIAGWRRFASLPENRLLPFTLEDWLLAFTVPIVRCFAFIVCLRVLSSGFSMLSFLIQDQQRAVIKPPAHLFFIANYLLILVRTTLFDIAQIYFTFLVTQRLLYRLTRGRPLFPIGFLRAFLPLIVLSILGFLGWSLRAALTFVFQSVFPSLFERIAPAGTLLEAVQQCATYCASAIPILIESIPLFITIPFLFRYFLRRDLALFDNSFFAPE